MDKELTGFEFTKTLYSYKERRYELVKSIFPAIFANSLYKNCGEIEISDRAWSRADACVERILEKEYKEDNLFET